MVLKKWMKEKHHSHLAVVSAAQRIFIRSLELRSDTTADVHKEVEDAGDADDADDAGDAGDAGDTRPGLRRRSACWNHSLTARVTNAARA